MTVWRKVKLVSPSNESVENYLRKHNRHSFIFGPIFFALVAVSTSCRWDGLRWCHISHDVWEGFNDSSWQSRLYGRDFSLQKSAWQEIETTMWCLGWWSTVCPPQTQSYVKSVSVTRQQGVSSTWRYLSYSPLPLPSSSPFLVSSGEKGKAHNCGLIQL